MKNYEEMAQSVLKRRDIEIKRRKKAFLIGAPCAAAVLVGVAGIGTAVASQSRGKYINPVVDIAPGAAEVNSSAEIGESVSTADIAVAPDEPDDYTNPNAGINDIKVLNIDEIKQSTTVEVIGPDDFTPYKLEDLDRFYGLRFNRLGELYPNWTLSYDKLGIYRHETNDGVVASLEMYNTCNTLKYTTEKGAEIAVSAQYEKFVPVSDEMFTADKPVKISTPEPITEYDENGNVIGQTSPAYDPTKDPAAQPVPDEGISTLNGYEALIYRYTVEGLDGYFIADINMTSRVRIIAEGLSEEEFLEVIDNFTNNVEGPVENGSESTDNAEPDAAENEIKVLDLDEFNIKEENVDPDSATFYEYTFEELNKIYGLRFNTLGELHPDWELSHDRLGTYNVEYFGKKGDVVMIHDPDNFSDRNTLNYITDNGASVTVSAQSTKFEPISDEVFTADKPDDPSKYTTETAYDNAGNPIGILSKPIDPDDWRPDADESVSTVNGHEALIYRNAEGSFLADLDMTFSRVRIAADGISEEEFLEILDEFTKK